MWCRLCAFPDPTDGYVHGLFPCHTPESELYFVFRRRSIGLPGLRGVVNAPGTWEARVRLQDVTATAQEIIDGIAFVQVRR